MPSTIMLYPNDTSWKSALHEIFSSENYAALINQVDHLYKTENVWPPRELLFNAFESCPFNHLKVVILGQDPYPTPGHAHGLAFSVPDEVKPLAKSLQNIYKELESDLGIPTSSNGNLTHWANQGVFLLNTILTVKAGEPNSHKKIGWQTFTNEVIKTISDKKEGIVFILWGKQAAEKIKLINQTKHHIIISPHPSPLSSYRGFFGSKPFSKSNELLALQDKTPINW